LCNQCATALIRHVKLTTMEATDQPNRIRFTKAALDRLLVDPGGKRYYVYDEASRGLCVCVATATKTFYLLRKVRGRAERVKLGRYPDTTIEQARQRAGKVNSEIDSGINPNELKRERRRELTLDELHGLYMERHARQRNRRPDNAENNYRRYLKVWGNRRLSEIARQDVAALHARLGKDTGQVTANIALTLLRSMFNRALEWDVWKGGNPTFGIRKFKEISRDRFLQPDEMPRFHEALSFVESETTRDLILTLLLTGARRGNVESMRWRELDLKRATWRIPDTKTGDPYLIPISPEAVALLAKRKAKVLGEWVFPGPGESGHLTEPKRAWRGLLLRAELIGLVDAIAVRQRWTRGARKEAVSVGATRLIPEIKAATKKAKALGIDPEQYAMRDVRMHDLRRTHGSWMAAGGASLPTIGKALGHKSVATTQIYARLNLDPVRSAISQATSAMMKGVVNSELEEPESGR